MSISVATRFHRFVCGVRLFCGLQSKVAWSAEIGSRHGSNRVPLGHGLCPLAKEARRALYAYT